MKLRRLLTLALAAQAIVTAAAFLASSLATGSAEFGTAQLLALLVSAAVAVLLVLLCARAIETSREIRTAELLAGQAQTNTHMMQAVIKTALDAYIQIDESGTVLEWSFQAEALTGWTRQEARGADVVDLLVAEPLRAGFRQRMARLVPELSAAPAGMRFEVTLVHRNGENILVEASSTVLRIEERSIINTFVRDITQTRAAEEQLIQSQKMDAVGQLTGGIAHEFNNMLTVITGTIEILADAVKDNPPLATITKLISEAADRGAALTSSLLSFARKQALQPAEIDVNELIEELAKLLLATFDKKIEIVTKLGGNVWLAYADRGQLSSALLNLAINARDAMLDGGRLTLTTRNVVFGVREALAVGAGYAGDYVEIEITDTGTGIPQAILERIFDPFFSTKEVGKGTGLGLSMVFGFVKQSGGGIKVASEEGRGTIFTIYLPKAEASTLRPTGYDDRKIVGGTETILCAEDDREVRHYVTVQLEGLGYKVIPAADATEALAIAAEGTPFDLLFTDIVMAGSMNGRELAEQMVAARPSLRVLFTSGYAYDSLHAQGRATMGAPLLRKPYRKAELARLLRRSLDTAVDSAGDAIPTPYSVQADVEAFLRRQAAEGSGTTRSRK
ncbi:MULTISPECIES: ATP-binding protein [Bradyrhizobium]|uniref:ATP-binding protein n=1 Tax=Bradyrhizobium TaxID=374 RepID=UPI00155E322B|nr:MULTISPECIES: ATP-binding protein [Bradyrhizobium]MDD1520045.1 hybrid sensor histidine kinase/response regulator [Bradyrhizobium sp. WBAH30]MDD1544289.1 hybrid sensor histidine kinase/response regulator [Bradyrhizobium sp. WBAH41]MDD1558171.1 hybrid sensor histidine kinase/response regulator [Bradyrhizobium sp. WBAH23]MDD1565569.1 hybrid sensor histidine kinase/response regulator [Bradyrhizobium sp. WBAH33]MDD1590699.1 hybrid sensor histidine kinase/response regulator [Bradyrhizobium sp. WB